ncbi:general stress protein [Rathayibacter sp. YIM 133350]|uniref:general stress protein n=1 Tax=Rathayibacter sp. YIM 133350 TaxID=3131992 RepID=UPI00307FB9A5
MSNTDQAFAYTDLAQFADYNSAQTLVDRLSDARFDVSQVRIVGKDLHSVEQVTGRLTVAKAAGKAAASGAWFGAFAGAFLTFFSSGLVWVVAILAGLAVGAVAGALYGAIAHALTRGSRDFSSIGTVEASSYTVMVAAPLAAGASKIAAGL